MGGKILQIRNLRWIILGLLFLETILNYIDAQTLAVVGPKLTKDLHLNPSLASVWNAFQIAYLITFLFGGAVIDRIGIRRSMVIAICWWSAAELLHAFARNEMDLMVCRFLFGFGYPGAYLVAAKVVAEWYPPKERALGTGAYTAGATIGATLAYPLVTYLMLKVNWRFPFMVMGLLGFGYVALWLLIYRSPSQHKWITKEEKDYITEGLAVADARDTSSKPSSQAGVMDIIKDLRFWGVALGRMIGDNGWLFYVVWMPTFFTHLGWSAAKIGKVGWIPFLFADIGSLGGGWLSGLLVKRGIPALKARLILMSIAAGILAFQFAIGMLTGTVAVIAVISLLILSTTIWLVNVGTVPVDAFPQKLVGRAVGLCSTGAIIGNILFIRYAGNLINSGDYTKLFIIISVLSPIACMIAFKLVNSPSKSLSAQAPAAAVVEE